MTHLLPRLTTLLLLSALALPAAEQLQLIAGGGTTSDGGPATSVKLTQPFCFHVMPDGSAWLAEQEGNRVRRYGADGTLVTVVGTGAKGSDGVGGPGTRVLLNGPHHLLPLPDGRVLIADTYNKRVLQLDPASGVVKAFAGTGENGFAGDGGPAEVAKLSDAYSLALSKDHKQVFIADIQNRRVRAVDLASGSIRTAVGNNGKTPPKDGDRADQASLVDPRSVAVDGDGRLYILERGGNCLRLVDTDGTIRTVVGSGAKGDSGDGGDARQATMNGPKDLAIDRDGSVLIADTENHVIRRYDPKTKQITRIAGTGSKGNGKPGAPLETALDRPHGIHVGPDGAIYISDSNNGRVLKWVR